MMTSLTFYGGINEVGGNKILLQDKDIKICYICNYSILDQIFYSCVFDWSLFLFLKV